MTPTVEGTTPNRQVTNSEEQEPTTPAEKEIIDIVETDPDLLSSDDEKPTTSAMATLTSVIRTKHQTANDLMTPTTINANGIMTTTAANTNDTDTELAALVDQAMERHIGTYTQLFKSLSIICFTAQNITTHPQYGMHTPSMINQTKVKGEL